MQIVVTAIIKCLREKYFLLCGLAWKCFGSVYYQSQVHTKYFCLTVRPENIPWRLLVTTIYTCCTSIIKLSGNNLFQGLAWKHFAVYIIRKANLTVRLKNMILWGLSVTIIIHLTHYSPVLLFYTPENIGKPLGFLMFSGGIEKQHWVVMGWSEKFLLFDIMQLWFWNHGMVHVCLYISCLCIL